MGNNPDIIEQGQATQFQKGQSGNPKGRPPNKLKRLLKEPKYTTADQKAILSTILDNYTFEEIKAIVANNTGNKKKIPEALMGFVTKEGELSARVIGIMALYLVAVRKGDVRFFSYADDRLYGKPKETIEHSGDLNVVANIPAEARDKRIDELLEKMKNEPK